MKSRLCFTEDAGTVIVLGLFGFFETVEPRPLNDSVAIDAKRILLRYGAPISVLDAVSQAHRIDFAREVAKTALPERQVRLRELLIENAYIVVDDD